MAKQISQISTNVASWWNKVPNNYSNIHTSSARTARSRMQQSWPIKSPQLATDWPATNSCWWTASVVHWTHSYFDLGRKSGNKFNWISINVIKTFQLQIGKASPCYRYSRELLMTWNLLDKLVPRKKNSFHIILSLHSTLWFRVAAPILNHDLICFTRSPRKGQKKVDSKQVNSCCPWQTASGEVRDTCEYCPVHVQKKKKKSETTSEFCCRWLHSTLDSRWPDPGRTTSVGLTSLGRVNTRGRILNLISVWWNLLCVFFSIAKLIQIYGVEMTDND